MVAELMIKIQFGENKKQALKEFIESYNKVTKPEELKMDSAETDAELAQEGIELAQIELKMDLDGEIYAELAKIIEIEKATEMGKLLSDIHKTKETTKPNKAIEKQLLASLKMSSSIKPKKKGESTFNKYLLPLFDEVSKELSEKDKEVSKELSEKDKEVSKELSEKDEIDERTLNTFFFRCGESRNFKDWNTYIIKLSQRIDEMKDDETKTKRKEALRKLIDQARTLSAIKSLPPELKNQERA